MCRLPLATVLIDEVAADDDAGMSMGAALATACAPALGLRLAGQADAGVLRVADGAPLQVGELLVAAGGSFRQDAVRWLETENRALVRDTSTATDMIYSLRDGGVASTVPFATLGTTRDRLVLQVVRAPSGSLVLHAAGYFGPGTLAASYWFVQNVLPLRATLTTAWYVIEWEDLDGTGGPTAADRYTLIASG